MDAELIYNALLRAEKRVEEAHNQLVEMGSPRVTQTAAVFGAVQLIREEIGNGLASRDAPPPVSTATEVF
ncbi:hypothetical protein [Phenylobacterium sp.]|uniref:hypothetical protein n=1 Tax=Phenylobacterium sp. TaxID=1871053 RepID=UPI0026017C03|nr:hypothetical protein [Phenylobacterium sp.]